jgi:Mg/Co/Ni transporter MgtE
MKKTISKIKTQLDVWSLYHREYIVGFIIGFILGALII